MGRIFLSHSSKQKGYVEIIAKGLGKQKVIYDAWTFEEGNKTLDEIYKGINNSGLFIFFISEESLESAWVKKEILMAEEYIKKGKIKQFFPLIIDDKIKHDDPRIPSWISDEYNIRYISKPTKCIDLIKQRLRLVNWELYPVKKELDQLFIGRTEQEKKFQSRIYDIDLKYPNCLIVNGLYAIGRRKFIRQCLIKSNTINQEYTPPIIRLDNRCSIEDFIIRIYGLGYSRLAPSDVTDLLIKTIADKIKIGIKLINEIEETNNILFIEDNNSIINRDGSIASWFLEIIKSIEESQNIILCLISLSRVSSRLTIENKSLFCVEIPELEKSERIGLFTSLLKIENMTMNKESLSLITEQFKGFPEQIFYTIELIKNDGLPYVLDNLNKIIEYNTEKVSSLIKRYEDNPLAMQVLKIFSEYEFISFEVLIVILQEDFESAKSIISELSNNFMIEYLGIMKENLRLNDAISDYIQRSTYKLDNKYKINLENHVKDKIINYSNDIERDISDYVIYVKEALKQNLKIPEKLLIPSHFVNAMRELYNYERKYDEVILLADRVLSNEKYLDKKIVKEIRYWLCLSLARKKDSRLTIEVMKINGADHNFLLGFYYRMTGRFNEALIKFNEVLEMSPNFYRAKRELIQVYLNTEDYDSAYALSKETYHIDKNNPYNLQSYFRCLLKLEGKSAKDKLLELLNNLRTNLSEKSDEMYRTLKAQFHYIIEEDNEKALIVIDEAITLYPQKIYPYLTKLEILNHKSSISEIESTLEIIEHRFDKNSDIRKKLHYLIAKCKMLKYHNKIVEAKNILNNDIKKNFSISIHQRIESELNL